MSPTTIFYGVEPKEMAYGILTSKTVINFISGTKIKWILDNVPGARERAERGELLFGNVDSWLIWNLTGGRAHVSDYSNCSRTMLFDIDNLCWDEELCARLGVPMSMLPTPVPSSMVYGQVTAGLPGLETLEGLPDCRGCRFRRGPHVSGPCRKGTVYRMRSVWPVRSAAPALSRLSLRSDFSRSA